MTTTGYHDLPQHPLLGARVRIPTSATAPQTGVGMDGSVVAVWECESDITGIHLRWIECEVRLSTGGLAFHQPEDLLAEEREKERA